MKEVTNFAKGGNCLPLQNLLPPFASMVRRENKFRVFFLFLVFEILEHLPYMFKICHYIYIMYNLKFLIEIENERIQLCFSRG